MQTVFTRTQDLSRLLDETTNFELAHALRLYCHAHAAAPLKTLLLACSDASMRRVDALAERTRQLTGRTPMPHIEVPPLPEKVQSDAVLHKERTESLSAAQRYDALAERVGDSAIRDLLHSFRAEHVRESAHFAQLIERSKERLD